MKKINHITMNTGNLVQYKDDSVVMKDVVPVIEEMIDKAISTGNAPVLDGTKVECAIDEETGIYVAELYLENEGKIPLIKTAGAINDEGGRFLWEKMKELHQQIYGFECMAKKCPKAPFICDLVFWEVFAALNILEWSGDFTKCFGIEILKKLAGSKKEEDNMELTCFQVGKDYPHAIGHSEGVVFDVTDSGILVQVFFYKPTVHEIEQFEVGNPFEMKLLQFRNIIFPLFKFGDLNWMDAPYSVHLSRQLTQIEVPTEGNGLSMQIALYDTKTGKLCKNRLIGLSTEISKKLIEMIEEQKKRPFNAREYDKNLNNVYAAYPTKKLVHMATDSFRIR